MKAGKLDQQISIYARGAPNPDAHGQDSPLWTLFAETWATVTPLRGREFFAAAQVHQEDTVRFQLRFLAGLDSSMRIVHAGLNYDITSIVAVGRNDYIEVLALQGVKDGA